MTTTQGVTLAIVIAVVLVALMALPGLMLTTAKEPMSARAAVAFAFGIGAAIGAAYSIALLSAWGWSRFFWWVGLGH